MNPKYISTDDEPTQRIRCPVHGFIRYSMNERKIIDHWTFARLRHIKQLAFTYYVYPGATHTRFEHSLGVMDLCGRAFDVLVEKQPDIIENRMKEVPGLEKGTLARARQIIRLLGLLHDIGHPAFSHTGACIMEGGHESLTKKIIESPEYLGTFIDQTVFPGAARLIAMFMEKDLSKDFPMQLLFFRHLVSAQMDLDRTDYLIRDAYHCGVEYGRFDYLRLIESLRVRENEETGALEIAIDDGGFHTFEALILARYQMHTQVYGHRLRRIYDYYLEKYLKAWGAENYKPIENVLKYNDLTLQAQIQYDAENKNDNDRQRWANYLYRRRHHKVIFERGDNVDYNISQNAQKVYRKLKKDNKNIDLIFDDYIEWIHKLYIEGEQEPGEELFVIGSKTKREELMTRRSGIIATIPKKLRTVRIFAYADENLLNKLRIEAEREFERCL